MNTAEKAKFDELSLKVDDLQIALDSEQADVTTLNNQKDATIASLNQTVIDLQAIIDAGGGVDNTAEIQAVLDKVQALTTDLQATV